MARQKELATADQLVAVRFNSGNVALIGTGSTPTTGYTVFFEPSPLLIFPPQYILFQLPPDGPAADVVTPFIAANTAASGSLITSLTVHDSKGAHQVPVIKEVTAPTEPAATPVPPEGFASPTLPKALKDAIDANPKNFQKDLKDSAKDHAKDFEKTILHDKSVVLEKTVHDKPVAHDKSPLIEAIPGGVVKIQKDKDGLENPVTPPTDIGDVLGHLADRIKALEDTAEGRPFIPLAQRPEVGGGPAANA